MSQFCNFCKNGDIIYNQINMVTGEINNIFLDISSAFCEVINHKDIFVNKETNTFYHKFSFGSNFSYLQWKKTKTGDWEWFRCDVNITTLIPIFELENKEEIKLIQKNEVNMDKIRIKSEIMAESYSIMRKYNLSGEDSKNLTDMIVKLIDTELSNKSELSN